MSEKQTASILLAMSAPPYWHCGRTTLGRSVDQLVALMPAAIMAVVNWGIPALRVMALSVAVCVAVEHACCKGMGRESSIWNLSAVVTGFLFAFLLPAAAPWWLVVIGAACAMLFGKMLFGNLGNCPVSTPIVGWAILFVSFPLLMDPNLMEIWTDYQDPLCILTYFGWGQASQIPLTDLLLGRQIAALGAGQVGALLLGGIYLLARGVVRMQVVFGALAGFLVPFCILQMISPDAASPLFHLGTGSAVLCFFFLATESSIAPAHSTGMVLYGLTCGLLTFAIRHFGDYADGAPFALLLASLLTPYFDMVRPKPFGVR